MKGVPLWLCTVLPKCLFAVHHSVASCGSVGISSCGLCVSVDLSIELKYVAGSECINP